MATALTNASAQSGYAIGIAFTGDFTHQRHAVWRVGDRSVHDGMDADFSSRRHALEHIFQDRHDPV